MSEARQVVSSTFLGIDVVQQAEVGRDTAYPEAGRPIVWGASQSTLHTYTLLDYQTVTVISSPAGDQ